MFRELDVVRSVMTAALEAPTVKIEQVIGERIAQVREENAWTQDEVGRRLGEVLGKSWSRQAVWNAERGQRVFTARELIALQLVFGVTVETLMRPFRDTDQIELPGVTIEWADLIEPSLPDTRAGVALHEAQTQVADVVHLLADLSESVAALGGHLDQAIREARIR